MQQSHGLLAIAKLLVYTAAVRQLIAELCDVRLTEIKENLWPNNENLSACMQEDLCLVYFVVLRSPPSPSFFKSSVYQRDSSQTQKVPISVH